MTSPHLSCLSSSLVPARQPSGGLPLAEGSARADGELGFGLELLAQWEALRHADGAAVLQRCEGHVWWERLGNKSRCRRCWWFFFFLYPRDEPKTPTTGLPHLWGVRTSHLHKCVPPLGEEPGTPHTGTHTVIYDIWLSWGRMFWQKESRQWQYYTLYCTGKGSFSDVCNGQVFWFCCSFTVTDHFLSPVGLCLAAAIFMRWIHLRVLFILSHVCLGSRPSIMWQRSNFQSKHFHYLFIFSNLLQIWKNSRAGPNNKSFSDHTASSIHPVPVWTSPLNTYQFLEAQKRFSRPRIYQKSLVDISRPDSILLSLFDTGSNKVLYSIV